MGKIIDHMDKTRKFQGFPNFLVRLILLSAALFYDRRKSFFYPFYSLNLSRFHLKVIYCIDES